MNPRVKNKKNNLKPSPVKKKVVKKMDEKQSDKWFWIALSVVSLIVFIIYFNSIKYGFLYWDDDHYITLNSHLQNLTWINVKLFFTSFYVGNYQPLTILTYAFEYKLVGENAALYHFNNIILHILNTFLVFVLIRKFSPHNLYVAFITASFFAVHPMHVESVAWISERKDVLYTFFFLLSLILYAKYLKNEKLKYYLATTLFFVLSCLSKSAAVILPLVMLLFDYYLNRKMELKIIIEKLPFFAISFIFGIVALKSQKAAMPVEQVIPTIDHIFIISNSFISYLFKAFIPVNLSAFYPYPENLGKSLPLIYYLSGLFMGLLFLFVWYSRKWGKDVIFGFLFFTITMVLVLQILSVGNVPMADRYTYVPYIGIFFIVGKLFEYLSAKKSGLYKKWLSIAFISGFVIFSINTYARVKIWESDETLFSDAINKYSYSTFALNHRGCYYLKIAQDDSPEVSSKKDLWFLKSFQDFDKIIELDTNFLHIYYNRGLSGFFIKEFAGAIADFDREIAKNPSDLEAYFARGNAKKEMNNYTGAIKDYDKTIELDPTAANAYFTRGNTKKDINDFTGALSDYDKSIELNPDFLKAYNNRSVLRCVLKDYKGTVADYDKMIELNPQDTVTIRNRKIIKSILESSKK